MTPTASPKPTLNIHRGVNFGNMLEAPNEGEWGLTVQEEYFDLLKEAGFGFVRLPVHWNAHAQQEAPYTMDPSFFARLDEVVNWELQRDLTIIVDFHHYEEMMWDPWGLAKPSVMGSRGCIGKWRLVLGCTTRTQERGGPIC